MVELRVPIADRRVIATEGKLEMVALVVADQAALHLDIETGGRGGAGAGIGAGRHADFPEVRHVGRERGADVGDELSLIEPGVGAVLVTRAVVDVAEAGHL